MWDLVWISEQKQLLSGTKELQRLYKIHRSIDSQRIEGNCDWFGKGNEMHIS